MPEDRHDRSSQDACACIPLAHRPRVLTNIQARRMYVLHLVRIISRNEEREKKKVPTRKRISEDGERTRLQRSGTRSKMETPGRTEPRSSKRVVAWLAHIARCLVSIVSTHHPRSKGDSSSASAFPAFSINLRVSSWLLVSGIEEVLCALKDSVHSRRQQQSPYSTCSCNSPSDLPSL